MGVPESLKRGRRGFGGFGVWVWRKSRALAGTERLRKRRRVFRVRRGGEKKMEMMKNKAPFDCSGGRKEMVKRRMSASVLFHWIRCRFSRRGDSLLDQRLFSVMFWVYKAHLKAHYITVKTYRISRILLIEPACLRAHLYRKFCLLWVLVRIQFYFFVVL